MKKDNKYTIHLRNKKGGHNFHFLQELEVGIVLKGTEIKSIREGKVNFKDSYAKIENGEVWLHNLHISIYKHGTIYNHDPVRVRKLLLNKREIRKFRSKIDEQGMSLIPKDIYINEDGFCKMTLALSKGKKLYDKREDIKQKDIERDNQRRLKDE